MSERIEVGADVTVLWQVKNFSHWNTEFKGRTLKSPLFKTNALPGCTWYLKLTPKGEIRGDDHIHVYLVLYCGIVQYAINCEMSFIGEGGLCIKSGRIQNEVLNKYKSLKLSPCILQEEAFSTRRSAFLPNNTLAVQCYFRMSHVVHSTVNERISFLTNITVSEVLFVWSIGNILSLKLNRVVFCRLSSSFNRTLNGNIKLKCSLTGDSLVESRIKFKIQAVLREPLLMTCKLSVQAKMQKGIKSVEISHIFKKSKIPQTVDFPLFLKRQDLLDYLEGSVLPVSCEFICSTGDYSETIATSLKELVPEKEFP